MKKLLKTSTIFDRQEDRKRSDVDMKIKKLELQKIEHEMSPAQRKLTEETQKIENKAKLGLFDFRRSKIDAAENDERYKADGYKRELDVFANIQEGGLGLDLPAGATYKGENITLKGPKRGDVKNFDDVITEEVLGKLIDPNKSDDDFDEDLKDLMDNRKSYEEAGVDVTTIFRRVQQRAPAKVNKIKKFLKDWL